ncbi:SDR family oxidoreductase [Edaphobacter aggregans]|uniref:SDR family oxidoreductase n=1 Tax=Edaphobacter aggregans TaxID=570835 RepID=UPI00055469A7|nr:SDR family oxidoreductase [Edaphobacter aggregans]
MILITGASGTVGRAVLEEMRKTGEPFKAMYRSENDAKKAPAGTASVMADFADKDSLNKAVAGVNTIFLVCSPIPQLVELEGNVIEACTKNGVRHIVLNSALGAGDYPKSFPSWHRKVEDKLMNSGLSYTILRPNGFFQNIVAYNAPTIRTQGAFYAGMGNAKTSLLDVRDVAAAAVKALSSPEDHSGKTYELMGPEALSNDEIARRISRIIGREVKYVDIPEEAQRKTMLDAGMPEWQVTALLDLQAYYVSGKCAAVTEVLPDLLGRAPITVDQFLNENKESFHSHAAVA